MTDQEPMWGANLRAEVEYRKAAEAEARRELAEVRAQLAAAQREAERLRAERDRWRERYNREHETRIELDDALDAGSSDTTGEAS